MMRPLHEKLLIGQHLLALLDGDDGFVGEGGDYLTMNDDGDFDGDDGKQDDGGGLIKDDDDGGYGCDYYDYDL